MFFRVRGSRSRDTAREDSDIGLPLYYDPSAPFPIPARETAMPAALSRLRALGARASTGGGWARAAGLAADK